MALVVSLVGIAFLLTGLYCILGGRPAGVSAASLAMGAAILVLTGRYLADEVDQPSTPSAPTAIRVYMLLLSLVTLGIGVAVATNVFTASPSFLVALVGLAGAALAMEVSFVVACAFVAHARRRR